MTNVMQIDGYKAVISFDPDIKMFRGEFVELNGGADFYSDTVDGLQREGEISLKLFFEVCREKGVEPFLKKSGKFVLRLNPEIHQKAVIAAKAEGKSLNGWANSALKRVLASS